MKDQFLGMNIKQKVLIKVQQMKIGIFLNFVEVKRLFVLVYLNQDADSKRFKTRIYYLPKVII